MPRMPTHRQERHDGQPHGMSKAEVLACDLAYRTIDQDPRVLLEADASHISADADFVIARLLGFDDQVVEDHLRLSKALPVLRVPIPQGIRAWMEESTFPTSAMRIAEYRLQSVFVVVSVAAEVVGKLVDRSDGTIKILCVRYRRRL